MVIWETVVEKILEPVAKTLASHVYGLVHHRMLKEFSVEEITEALERKKLSFDTTFRIAGTFSEFVPFADFATLVKPSIQSGSIGTCRLGDIVKRGKYLGALFPLGTEKATKPAIPIVYSTTSKSRKMFSFSTGDQVELECKLLPLDYGFRGILLRKETFCFKGKPFGLEIRNVKEKKPKKVNEFIIDSFFLSSLAYEGGVDHFFSMLLEIEEIIRSADKTPFPLTSTGILLYELQKRGEVEALLTRAKRHFENGKKSTRFDCIEGKLHRFSNPVNIVDKTDTQKVLDNMKRTINEFSFVDSKDSFEEYEILRALFDFKFTSWEKKFLSKFKELEPITRKLYNRPDLREAWDFYLRPRLSIDFQFDQVSPSLKQTINTRKILEKKGLA